MGTVGLNELSIQTIVGLLPLERIQPQEIRLNIQMTIDFRRCNQSGKESLEYSVDYASVATDFTEWIQESKFELIESIALLGCQRLLKQYPQITACSVEVHKPEAVENAQTAWVSWTETRST